MLFSSQGIKTSPGTIYCSQKNRAKNLGLKTTIYWHKVLMVALINCLTQNEEIITLFSLFCAMPARCALYLRVGRIEKLIYFRCKEVSLTGVGIMKYSPASRYYKIPPLWEGYIKKGL